MTRRLTFELHAEPAGTAARAGAFRIRGKTVPTPVFMPVGTHAAVRGMRVEELVDVGSQVMLANTYHLHLRPGPEVFRRIGGIHRLMRWPGVVLTDSGGFQIYSMPAKRRVTEDGARFASYVDGRDVMLTPELSVATQRAIDSDIMMVLDQCVPATSDRPTATAAMELTHRWAARSLAARGDSDQALFGIVQGAMHADLRRASADALASMDFDGLAIGGLAVGESRAEREDMTALAAALLPRDRPRYLMGVADRPPGGSVDMFDCIIPSAHASQGVAYTSVGRVRLTRSVYKLADEAIDPDCDCYTCRDYSRAYVHHLLKARESLGRSLTSLHNLRFYHRLMARIRAHIVGGTFADFYRTERERLVL